MDVTNPEQAGIAEDAGAVGVMVLDKLPYDIRLAGGVARTADLKVIIDVMNTITIPVSAKCRIGHCEEARLLEEIGVDLIDESEVLTPLMREHILTSGCLKHHLLMVLETYPRPSAEYMRALQ